MLKVLNILLLTSIVTPLLLQVLICEHLVLANSVAVIDNNIDGHNGTTRCLSSLLTRSPLNWIQQALNTASNAFSLGIETAGQWFGFGINAANDWFNFLTNPQNNTNIDNDINGNSTNTSESLKVMRLQTEIQRLEKDLGNWNTWFRRVKEKRLVELRDQLKQLAEKNQLNINGVKPETTAPAPPPLTPLDVSNVNFNLSTTSIPHIPNVSTITTTTTTTTTTEAPMVGTVSNQTQDDTVVSIFS